MKEAPQFLVRVTQDTQGHVQTADWYERADRASINTMADAAPVEEKPLLFKVSGEDVISPTDAPRIDSPAIVPFKEDSSLETASSLPKTDSFGSKLVKNKGVRVAIAGLAAFAAANLPGFIRSSNEASAQVPTAPDVSQNIGRTDNGGRQVDSRIQERPIESSSSFEKVLTGVKPEASKSTGANSMAAVVSTPDGKKYSVLGGIDPLTGKVVLRTKGQLSIKGVVTSVSASETDIVAVSSFGGVIEIFKGNERKVITDTNFIPDLSVTPDGSKAFISHTNGTFSILDLALNSLSAPLSTQSTGSTGGSSSTQLGVLRGTPLLQIGPGNFRNFGTRADIYGYVQVEYSDELIKVTQYGASEKAEFARTRIASYKDEVTGKDVVFGIKNSTSSTEVDKIYKYTDNVLSGIYPLSNTLTNPLDISIGAIAIDVATKTGYAGGIRYDNKGNTNPRVFKFQLENPASQESMPAEGLPAIGDTSNIFFLQHNGISKILVEITASSEKGYYAFDEATNSWEIVPILTSDTTIYIPAALNKYTPK